MVCHQSLCDLDHRRNRHVRINPSGWSYDRRSLPLGNRTSGVVCVCRSVDCTQANLVPPTEFSGRSLAFSSPALVAWIWGGLFLVMLCVPGLQSGLGDTGDIIAMILMYSLLFLAFPASCGFIILTLFTKGLETLEFAVGWPYFLVYMLLVGAVPGG